MKEENKLINTVSPECVFQIIYVISDSSLETETRSQNLIDSTANLNILRPSFNQSIMKSLSINKHVVFLLPEGFQSIVQNWLCSSHDNTFVFLFSEFFSA